MLFADGSQFHGEYVDNMRHGLVSVLSTISSIKPVTLPHANSLHVAIEDNVTSPLRCFRACLSDAHSPLVWGAAFGLRLAICQGLFEYADGRRFEGRYANGKRDGWGTFYNCDGSVETTG